MTKNIFIGIALTLVLLLTACSPNQSANNEPKESENSGVQGNQKPVITGENGTIFEKEVIFNTQVDENTIEVRAGQETMILAIGKVLVDFGKIEMGTNATVLYFKTYEDENIMKSFLVKK